MIQANTNNRWARLSQSEKAELLGIYASKGYHDLANIIAHYNSCGGKLYGDGGSKKRETAYARKYREEQEAKARMALEHPTLSNAFRNDISSETGDKYYDVINARYHQSMDALRRNGFAYEDALRLAPLMVTQNIVEGGWRVARPDDNNFGGLRENGRFLKFDSPEEYYDNYLDLLDRKWGASRGFMNNWRTAQTLDDWSRILNREDLHLWSKERYDAYNREHSDSPVYLYAPEWENNSKSYRTHLAGVEPRVNTYLDMVLNENPYTKEMYDAPIEPVAQPNDRFNLSMDQFQKLLESNRSNGNKAEGGRLHGDGGPEKTYEDYLNEYNAAAKAWKDANSAASKANKERWEYHDSLPSSVKYSPNFHWKNIPGLRQRIEKEERLEEEAEKRRSEYYKAGAAIGEATVKKYRGTKHDLLKYPDWARTEEGAINYLVNDYIRESAGAQEVADYFNSYALSPGFQRIIDNQWQWGHDRHPYKRIYDFANYGKKGFTSSAERMRTSLTELPMTTDGVFDMNAVPGMGFNVTGPGYHFIINTAAQPYNQEDERFPYWFELTHEMMHDRNFFSSGQGEALDQNTNTAPGHDSWGNEKHSDLEALRFMLFKEGIYDSRGEKDCTPEDIAKMRKKWPNLRPLQQMDDEKAAWMINHVADAGNQESLYDNHLGNISANGGKIHIKPENRGKFTALKERTGHSASWFKEHGTPAQKKMAVFALNARKWKHEDGGPLANYLDDGGPYGVIPLGGDYLTYLQNIPEVSGGMIEPSVVTAALPAKFNGSQAAAARYAEGYLKGAKPVSEAISRFGQDIFNTVDTVVGLTPTPAGAITWLGHMGADAAEGEWGKVGRDAALALALGTGARGISWLKNYVDDATNFGEDIFRAFTDSVPGRVSTNFTYAAPATRAIAKAIPAVSKAASTPYEIENLGGGYMLKSLMRGNPLEKQISKNGTVNVNNVRALVGKGSKVEQAVVDKVLASEEFAGKKSIDYNKFRRAVQDELITYNRTFDSGYENHGMSRIGFSDDDVVSDYINRNHVEFLSGANGPYSADALYYDPKTDRYINYPELKNNAKITSTYTFSSDRIPNGSGKHYDPNTLGHSRTYTTADEPNVLHVMESQSDWAQEGLRPTNRFFDSKGNDITEKVQNSWTAERTNPIERIYDYNSEFYIFGDTPEEMAEFDSLADKYINLNKQIQASEDLNFDDFLKQIELREKLDEIATTPGTRPGRFNRKTKTPHLRPIFEEKIIYPSAQEQYLSDHYTSRQIQENLRYAAEKGQTKMRYPTRETAAKIEGYQPAKDTGKANEVFDWLRENNRKSSPYSSDIYEKTKKIETAIENDLATPEDIKRAKAEIKKLEALEARWLNGETTYSADLETILYKYEGFPKEYQKLYKNADVRTITDPKGNTWYEVDVPENYLQQEWTYKNGGSLRKFANISDLF